jgi:hypothetical protein
VAVMGAKVRAHKDYFRITTISMQLLLWEE